VLASMQAKLAGRLPTEHASALFNATYVLSLVFNINVFCIL